MSIATIPTVTNAHSVGYDILNFDTSGSPKGKIQRTLDTKRELRTLARNQLMQNNAVIEVKDIFTGKDKNMEVKGLSKAVIIDNQSIHSAGKSVKNAYWREKNTGIRQIAHTQKPSLFEGPSTPEETQSARRGKKRVFDSFIKMQISGNPIV